MSWPHQGVPRDNRWGVGCLPWIVASIALLAVLMFFAGRIG